MGTTPITLSPRERLKYVVPGYIWVQPRFKIDWSDASNEVEQCKGIVLVESPSVERREYAAASFLSLMLRRDYHADIGWTSFFSRKENQFLGSVSVPKHRKIQAIAVKQEPTPYVEEQVQDLAAVCRLSVIAAPPGFKVYLPHTVIKINARTDTKMHQGPVSARVI